MPICPPIFPPGVKHVVIVSSMGGTDPSNFLNTIGEGQT